MNIDQHLDYDAVNALKEVMEDDFTLLVNTFFQDSNARILTLRYLILSTDNDAIRRAAHSFKGSCSNLGALRLARLCSLLEHKALQSKFNSIADDLRIIEEEFAIVHKMLVEYLR